MRMEHLDYLLEIDKYHSISAAARELFIGQTALSSVVKSIEKEVGFAIFRRTHSGVETTPEGEEALALIWDILSCFEEIKLLQSKSEATPFPVELISSPSINCSIAAPLSKAYQAILPGSNLIFRECEGSDVGGKIIQNDFNVGLTYFGSDIRSNIKDFEAIAQKYQIVVKPVFQDRFYLLVRRDHPFAGRESIHINDVKNMNMAMLSYFSNREASATFVKFQEGRNRFTTYSNVSLIKEAIIKNNLVSTLSGYAIFHERSEDNSLLRAIPLTGLLKDDSMVLCLIHRNLKNLRYSEQVLIKCIEDYFSSLPPL